ncbi:hypothetical protein ACH5RR_038628 [Cinchona calisaya]|uniref:Uncharacterized protein n=1 Tax=Cinchona calisaya TaxID=153742 RepID=A0ABD2XYX3_9GENT
MADQGRPGDLIVIQYQKPIPQKRGSAMKIKYTRISKFKNYVELELYLFEKCGGCYRTYPGGADYPVISYTKYNDGDNVHELRTEPWLDFAASVHQILINRIQA